MHHHSQNSCIPNVVTLFSRDSFVTWRSDEAHDPVRALEAITGDTNHHEFYLCARIHPICGEVGWAGNPDNQ